MSFELFLDENRCIGNDSNETLTGTNDADVIPGYGGNDILLGLGGNDVLRGLSPDETRRNLDAILAELQRREIPVLLTGMLAPRNMGPEYVGQFDAIFPELAREYGAELYPFFLDGVIGQQGLMLDDGLHPNADGIATIVGRVAPIVTAELE